VCRRGDLREILTATSSDGCPRRHTSRLIRSAAHTLRKTHNLEAISRLQLLDRTRPVFFQQSRQGPVGEDFALGLALRAIVCFVRGVTDSLNRSLANRARHFESAMNRHAFAECRYLLGEAIAGLLNQTIGPVLKRCLRRDKKSRDLLNIKLLRELDRRQPRGVQNLIRVRVSDPVEQASERFRV
jgi:hypothetical protein